MYNPIQKISLLFYDGLGSLRHHQSWLPLFYFWLLNALGLMALTHFAQLPGGGWMALVLGSLFGRETMEYPRLFLQLPDVQRQLYLFLAVTVGPLFRGASILYLVRYHTRGQVGQHRPWHRALRLLPGHLLINLFGLILFLLPLLAIRFWAPLSFRGSSAGKGLLLGAFGLGFVVQACLLYAPLFYLLYRSGIREAVRASFRFTKRHSGVTAGLVVIPFLLALPLQGVQVARRSIIEMFRPEMILWLLLFTSLATLLILFLQLSTLVRFYAGEELRQTFTGEWDDRPS